MLGTLTKIFGTEVLKIIIANNLKKINLEMFHFEKDEMNKFKNNFPKFYGNHFKEICKWADSIPFIGLAKPKKTEVSTIELIIASDIIKYNDDDKQKINEFDILNTNDNILLLGAPGAGKTTTLKRLIIKYFNDFKELENPGFPVLVRLRDIPLESTLYKYILDIFGINYEDKITKYNKKIKKKDKESGETYVEEEIIVEKVSTYVGKTPINLFMANFLNESNCFLLLDGIDELHKSVQLKTFREIEELGLKLDKGRIIMTVRKSELNKIIDSFTTFEIASLSFKQIKEIAAKWLLNSDAFIIELENKPYKDLANRPIFLTFLLILFEKYSSLPTQPSEVYEDTTYLILKEWDEHRDIIRLSKYGDFNTRKKIKFIAELSYNLTYKVKQKVFSSRDLEHIYELISKKYGLPEDDAKSVVSEIESHTGLIVESKSRNFEFSHLSIQEFLCAKHLVNLPFSKETINYFFEYPEPLAIAICISGEPSLWFANLILNSSLNITNFPYEAKMYYSSLYTLLSRLLVETPSFKISVELGIAFFYLIRGLHQKSQFKNLINEWFEYQNVKESLALCLKKTHYSTTIRGYYLITRKELTHTDYFIHIPISGEIPNEYMEKMKKENLIILKNNRIE